MTDPDLADLLARARAAFDQLTPAEQAAHRREQAISWAWGQLALKYGGEPPVSRARIGELYDRRRP